MRLVQDHTTRTLSPEAVPFDLDGACKLLKIRRTAPEAAPLREMTRRLADRYRACLEPRYRYAVRGVAAVDVSGHGVRLDDGARFEGAGLCRLLRDAPYAAFFALTLGARIDAAIAVLAREDAAQSYILDGVASTFAHGLLQVLTEDVREAARGFGCTLSRRFAPGYHRWDLRQQENLFALLQAHEIDLRLSETCFMRPQKSLSGVYGFRRHPA